MARSIQAARKSAQSARLLRGYKRLKEALQDGSLRMGDEDGAIRVLSIDGGSFARLPMAQRRMRARDCLSQATRELGLSQSPAGVSESAPSAATLKEQSGEDDGVAGAQDPDESRKRRQSPTVGSVEDSGQRQVLATDATERDASDVHGQNRRESAVNEMLPYVKKPRVAPADGAETGSGRPQPDKAPNKSERKSGSDVARRGSGPDGKPSARVDRPSLRFSDVGGVANVLEVVRETVELPLLHFELYQHLGVEPPRGILLHGPPGSGKTLLANAIAGEFGVAFLKIAAPEIVSGMSGDSERKLRDLFAEARECAPCLLFMDEVDAICSRRDTAYKDMEKRIVAQLLTCMDSVSPAITGGKPVVVLGATNRPDSIDPALRRAGRFDREIEVGLPDEAGRKQILEALSRKLRLSEDVDLAMLARRTAGYVGADLAALTTAAATAAEPVPEIKVVEPVPEIKVVEPAPPSAPSERPKLSEEQLRDLYVEPDDYDEALGKVQPSALREGFTTVPDVTWDDVGAMERLRQELMTAIVEPIRDPERFRALGLNSPAGVLLYGPPGCGKTLLAKAVARESSANFISVKGPELLNKFVGESERSVRSLFRRARASAPCMVFFDELDALAPRRGGGYDSGGGSDSSTERVVNQLLTELDGMDGRKQVFVVAATNRPDIIDPAMLRPGRLDKLLYVGLPEQGERQAILRTLSKNTPLAAEVDFAPVSSSTDGFSGADLAALVREATLNVLKRNGSAVEQDDFNDALKRVFPSVSPRDAKVFERLGSELRASRTHIQS